PIILAGPVGVTHLLTEAHDLVKRRLVLEHPVQAFDPAGRRNPRTLLQLRDRALQSGQAIFDGAVGCHGLCPPRVGSGRTQSPLYPMPRPHGISTSAGATTSSSTPAAGPGNL